MGWRGGTKKYFTSTTKIYRSSEWGGGGLGGCSRSRIGGQEIKERG